MNPYLQPTEFINSDDPIIQRFAQHRCQYFSDPLHKAVSLYKAVRDDIWYDPYQVNNNPDTYKATTVIQKKTSFCVPKAILLVALCRAQEIPARLGLADVRNHLASPKLLEALKTNIFYGHGYAEIQINNQWVKATPIFNLALCQRFGVKPLEKISNRIL